MMNNEFRFSFKISLIKNIKQEVNMKRGKKYLEAASKIEKGKAYSIEEAVK